MDWQKAVEQSSLRIAVRTGDRATYYRNADGSADAIDIKGEGMRQAIESEVEGFLDWEPYEKTPTRAELLERCKRELALFAKWPDERDEQIAARETRKLREILLRGAKFKVFKCGYDDRLDVVTFPGLGRDGFTLFNSRALDELEKDYPD